MQNKILIASAITAGFAAAAFYLIKRNRTNSSVIKFQPAPAHASRHITNVFARAKH